MKNSHWYDNSLSTPYVFTPTFPLFYLHKRMEERLPIIGTKKNHNTSRNKYLHVFLPSYTLIYAATGEKIREKTFRNENIHMNRAALVRKV